MHYKILNIRSASLPDCHKEILKYFNLKVTVIFFYIFLAFTYFMENSETFLSVVIPNFVNV